MLYDLAELERTLETLSNEFESLHQSHLRMRNNADNNRLSVLIRIPKVILLQRVMIFLTDKQIALKLSCTCRAIRKLVYSPLGFKILTYTRLPIRYKYKNIQLAYSEEEERDRVGIWDQVQNAPLSFDQGQIKVLTQKKSILRETLREEYEMFQAAKEKFEGLDERIRVEKKLQQKYRDKGKILEEEVNLLEDRNNQYRETLRQLNQEFEGKMNGLQERENLVVQERNKLQNQKEALVAKIREYQAQIQRVKKEGLQSKEVLKKVKNFLVYKQV